VPDEEPERFKIGELIRRSGFSRQQIQNLIVMGAIREESLTASGQRLFSPRTVRRLKLIRGVLQSGGKEYSLGEFARTWRTFLKALVLAAALLCAAGGARLAGSPGAAAATPAGALAAEDRAAIRRLFDDLAEAMKRGDSAVASRIFSAAVPQTRVHRVTEQLEAEFTSRSYESFSCSFDPAADLEALGDGRVRVQAVIRYQYHDKSQPAVPIGDDTGQEFVFELVKTSGSWGLVSDGSFFDTMSATQDTILGRVFLWAAVGLVVLSFWGWMFLDCCFREWGGRRWPWVAAVGLLPGLGALAYFFTVWIRQGPED
jgi:DNA-binding transcriptional MerR regulator